MSFSRVPDVGAAAAGVGAGAAVIGMKTHRNIDA